MTVLDGYLERRELAAQLHRSERTISRWHVKRDGPPFVKVGSKVYYRIDAVREWLEHREQREQRSGKGASGRRSA